MPLYNDWPKNAVRPDGYTIDTTAFAEPLPIWRAFDIIEELRSLFNIDQAKECFALFCYTGGTPGVPSLRTHIPTDEGYESGLSAFDQEKFISRLEIARKVDWKHYHAVCVFDRDASKNNKFAISSKQIKLGADELECFSELLRLIVKLPGKTFSLPELPLIALINEMNGKT